MRFFTFIGFLIFCNLLSAQQNPVDDFDDIVCKETEAHSHFLETRMAANPLTENYDLKYYRFEWYIDPALYFIEGKATVYFQTLEDDFSEIHFDFSSELIVDSVVYHNQNNPFTQSGDYLLTITLPTVLSTGTFDSLTIAYAGAPPSNGFGSFEQTDHNGIPIIWTLSEPYGSQDWWPCKNGLTDKIDSIDVIVTTLQEYRAASNGVLVSELAAGTDMTYHWRHRYPIAPYLIAIAVTNFVQYTDTVLLGNGAELPMLNYIYPESLVDAQAGTSDLVQVMQYFDSLFVTYPFYEEKYGHAQWAWGGGMEHQTMSFVSGFGWTLLSHELAHQWFGDMVTCGSWEDIWLNEGFATYLEGLSRERFLGNDSWNAWKTSRVNTITSQPGGSVRVNDTTSVSRIFSGRLSYSKGAYLLHMLRWKLGNNFFQGVRNYLNAYGYDYAKTRDLQDHLEAASGVELTEFFEDWFVGEGYPSYTVTWDQNGKDFLVNLGQNTSHPSVDFFEMPVPLKLSGDGVDTTIRLEHTQDGQLFLIPVSFAITSVEFDPEIWLISRDNVVQEGTLSSVSHDLADGSSFTLYPNPVRDALHVIIDHENVDGEFHWQTVNGLGQRMEAGRFSGEANFLSVKNLTPGYYRLLLTGNDGGIDVVSFVKE